METFGFYSLKVGIIMAMFWGIYNWFLQKETFYRFNRFFLLAGIVVSLILPLITVHYMVETKIPTLPSALLSESEAISSTAEIDTNGIPIFLYWSLLIIYLAGICVLLIVRLLGLLHIFKTIRINNYRTQTHFKLIESADFNSAFSFFYFVFIPKDISKPEKLIILKHEEAHIRQKHWMDLWLINLLSLLWWFNPFIRLYEKAIRNNHEYLADQAVLTDYEQIDYQQTLINQWFKTPVFPLTNSFAYTNQLKRITMMKKNISNPSKKLFSLLAFPFIALFLWAFAEPQYVFTEHSIFLKNDSITESKISIVSEADDSTIKIVNSKSQSIENDLSDVNDKSGVFSFKSEDDLPLVIIDGKKADRKLEELIPDEIHAINVLKDQTAIEQYGEEGKNGVIEIITKKHAEETKYQSPEEPDVEVTGYGLNPPPFLSIDKIETDQLPLVIINGKKSDQKIEDINIDDILSVEVIKDKTISQSQYGEEGKNGVILIITKSINK